MHTARMYGSEGVFCATVYFAYVYIWISYVKIVNVNISGVYSGQQSTYRRRVEIGGVYLIS
jgi:succinate-acetate transporter protein